MSDKKAPDYGVPDEDFQWPEVSELRTVDAVRLLYDIESQATETNTRADRLKKRKATAQVIMQQVLDREELDSARAAARDGKTIQYTPYDFDVFNIIDEDAFKEWAAAEAERFYDPEPRLRQGVFLDEMRRRHQDGEALPPGVQRVTLPKLSRTAVASRRKA